MSLMKSDRTKAPKSDRIAGYAITLDMDMDTNGHGVPITGPAVLCCLRDWLHAAVGPPRAKSDICARTRAYPTF